MDRFLGSSRHTSICAILSPEDYEALHARIVALLERYKKLVGDMRKAGVEFLAGTDASGWNPVLPGFGLHEELALLVEAGLTPMEALQSATRNPARYFNKLDEMGTVEVKKAADLVLLNANPLEDIHNTQKIEAVIMTRPLLFAKRSECDAEAVAVTVGQVPDLPGLIVNPKPADSPATRTHPASICSSGSSPASCWSPYPSAAFPPLASSCRSAEPRTARPRRAG